jgi:hypothetical protein
MGMRDSWDSFGNREREDFGDNNAERERRILEWDRRQREDEPGYLRIRPQWLDELEQRKHPPVPKGVWR